MPVKLWMALDGSGCATWLLFTCLQTRVFSNLRLHSKTTQCHLALDRLVYPFKLSYQNNQEFEHLKPTKSLIVKTADSLFPHQLGSCGIFYFFYQLEKTS